MTYDPITSVDDLVDLRVGAIVTLKGKLERVRRANDANPVGGSWYGGPVIDVTFCDWSETWVHIPVDSPYEALETITRRESVTIKARVTHEDGDLEAIAIWTPGGAPIPLGNELSRDVTGLEAP